MNSSCGITCSTACRQLQSCACKLRTDSKGSRCSSWSWCSARWGLSPFLKLSSASCRREACLCASSSACRALSASMANRAAWARDSSASAFSAAHDYKRHNTEFTAIVIHFSSSCHVHNHAGHCTDSNSHFTTLHALPHYLPTWAVCLQLWPHCFSALCASSSSCLSLEVSAQGPVGRRVGGVPGEPWPDGKCSQILLLIPLRPATRRINIDKTIQSLYTTWCPESNFTNLKSYEMVPRRCFLIGQVVIYE